MKDTLMKVIITLEVLIAVMADVIMIMSGFYGELSVYKICILSIAMVVLMSIVLYWLFGKISKFIARRAKKYERAN